jgi:hypothetical protein
MLRKTAIKKTKGSSAPRRAAARKDAPKKKASSQPAKKKPLLKPATKKKASTRAKTPPPPSFEREIDSFVVHIESLSKSLTPTMDAMVESFKKSSEIIDAFIKNKGVRKTEKDGSESYKIKPADLHQFERNLKAARSAYLAVTNIPQIFLCSLIHKYDAYLGRLLRVAFSVKPEILAASEKTLTYTDLADFTSLTAARESLIEKEVESVIRDSHIDHFNWMENRFGLPLRKELDVWATFVEITERRNLFVHCDGIVSSQYLKVCKKQGVQLESDLKVGDQLEVDIAYFSKAFDCMLEIGIKLGHVLWRKLQPDDIGSADKALQNTGYELLVEKRFELAKMILRFATETLKNVSSDQIRRTNLINLCTAYKFSGNQQSCIKLLDSEDWTACAPEFQLAVAVHKDSFAEASAIMEVIGKNGAVSREQYSTWPLFKTFRQSKEFLSSYRKLFGENFVVPEDFDMSTKKSTKASRRRPKGHA